MLFSCGKPAFGGELDEACGFAYKKLKSVDSAQVSQTKGTFTYRGRQYRGCITKLIRDRSRISDAQNPGSLLYPFKDSPVYRAGWRADIESEADGPDGTAFRMIRRNTFCFVEGKWDGGDDGDSRYVPPKRYEVIVNCTTLKH
jgi:hypothetical protein